MKILLFPFLLFALNDKLTTLTLCVREGQCHEISVNESKFITDGKTVITTKITPKQSQELKEGLRNILKNTKNAEFKCPQMIELTEREDDKVVSKKGFCQTKISKRTDKALSSWIKSLPLPEK